MQNKTIYQIISGNYNGHTIYYYDQFEFIFTEGKLHEEIIEVIRYTENSNIQNPFRFSVEMNSVQFTCSLYPKEKEIYICTKQLSYELALTNWYEIKNLTQDIEHITEHANKIASIPIETTPTIIDQITSRYNLIDLSKAEFDIVNDKTKEITEKLIEKVNVYDQTWFEKLSDFGLDLTANYKLIRIHLLKFLALLPSLDHEVSGVEVKRIFLETLRRLVSDSKLAKIKKMKGQNRPLPRIYILTLTFLHKVSGFISAKLLAYMIRKTVSIMAKRFIAGESISLAQKSLKGLLATGRDATLDQLGELVVSKKEADEYERAVIEIIHGMAQHIPKGELNGAGINKAHVSIKVSALTHNFIPYAFNETYNDIAPRLINILKEAKVHDVFINIDAEHYHYRDCVFEIYKKVLEETEELKDFAKTGIVIQAYLRDGHKHFDEVCAFAKKRGIRMPIRLVKGAYWDVETVEATAHNFEAPQFLNKEETDIHFRQLIYKSLEASEAIHLAVASHNILDHSFAEALRSEKFPDAPVIEHQCLHMTYEALSYGLSLMGWPTRNYIPVGNLLVGMAYLVRRIMENSSQVGILTIMRSHKKQMEFKTPNELLLENFIKKEIIYDDSILKFRRKFKNIYPLRTYLKDHFHLVTKELDKQLEFYNTNTPEILDGEEAVVASSNPELKIGKVKKDTVKTVNEKMERLFKGFYESNWKENNSHRHAILLRLSDELLIRRDYLTALIMYEAGKTLDEAIADVDEAIDFIQFYVKQYIEIDAKHSGHRAKGVFGIIAPWNFPLAIPVGMATAALVTGNSVLLKPAEQTPLIVLEFLKLARLVGISEDVFDIAIGEGDIGASIVNHELTSGVVFTGSREVGVQIYNKLKKEFTSSRYDFPPVSKTVITEMGGKNAIIITNNCELDETVSGVIYAAFAHSGQKCSAASRIIIDEKIKDSFISRFVSAVEDIKVGKSYDFDTMINPLISQEDKLRVQNIVKQAKEEASTFGGKVHVDYSQNEYPGFCVGPAVIELPAERALHEESIAKKEIFGPVIHLIPYKDFKQALKIFNSTEYALTGGIFCQSQDDIDLLMPKMKCGNIYINRPNTGARVAIEPFGGFKMSGTGPKAGGVDYLFNFMRISSKPINENFLFDNKVSKNLDMAIRSRLNTRQRKDRACELLDRLMNRFEVFFGHIDESQKDSLQSLKDYLGNKDNLLDIKEFKNRTIPGQINFDKRDLGLGDGLFITGGKKISFELLIEVVVNLYIGNGINILSVNESSFKVWQPIVKLIYRVGFSPYNITHSNINRERYEKVLSNFKFEFIVYENDLSLKNELIDEFFTKFHEPKSSLVKTIVSGEDIQIGKWELYIKHYTIARSIAVNTMRHGAPLELDF